MKSNLPALCWAAAIVGVALAGAAGAIDESSTTTLLVALPAVAWTSLNGRACSFKLRRA